MRARVVWFVIGSMALLSWGVPACEGGGGTSEDIGQGTGVPGHGGAGGTPQHGGGGATSTATGSGASHAGGGTSTTTGSGGMGSTTTTMTGGTGGGSGGTGPCKTECLGVECGPIPDGCGATLDCGDCGDGTDTCIKLVPQFQIQVKDSIEQVKIDHPEYFDFSDDLGGGSIKVLDATALAYRDAVVAGVNALGPTCVPDPNDDREIRVRGAQDWAENYLIRTSGGYTVYKYTSTCTPAGF